MPFLLRHRGAVPEWCEILKLSTFAVCRPEILVTLPRCDMLEHLDQAHISWTLPSVLE